MSDEKHHNVTRKMLEDGLSLQTGYHHVLHLVGDKLHLRLDVEHDDDATEAEKFTLVGFRGEAREYEQTRTTEDDIDPSEDFWEFVFTDVIPDLTYSLEIDSAAQDDEPVSADDEGASDQGGQKRRKYLCFEDIPWTKFEKALES